METKPNQAILWNEVQDEKPAMPKGALKVVRLNRIQKLSCIIERIDSIGDLAQDFECIAELAGDSALFVISSTAV